MKHFVIINQWTNDGLETSTSVLGVVHTLEEAKEIFNKCAMEEKKIADKNGLTIYDDCETVFDAGEDGYYVSNHTNLYIEEV